MNFFDRLTGRGNQKSRSVAKERLQLVLVHDRTDISPQVLEQLKDELIAVISKYVDIDRELVQVQLTQDQRESRLTANIPLLDAPRRRIRA